MAESHILSTLHRKRDAIEATITAHGKKIEGAKRDLLTVNAVLRLFELNGEPQEYPVRVDISRIRKRGEIVAASRVSLKAEGPLDTREFAQRLMRINGLDDGDAVLRQSVSYRIVQALSITAKRGRIETLGKRKGVRTWSVSRCFS
jgi:hypothetical protein